MYIYMYIYIYTHIHIYSQFKKGRSPKIINTKY